MFEVFIRKTSHSVAACVAKVSRKRAICRHTCEPIIRMIAFHVHFVGRHSLKRSVLLLDTLSSTLASTLYLLAEHCLFLSALLLLHHLPAVYYFSSLLYSVLFSCNYHFHLHYLCILVANDNYRVHCSRHDRET